MEGDMIVACKKLLDRHLYIQDMDHVQAQGFNLASCLAKTLWTKGPILALYSSILYIFDAVVHVHFKVGASKRTWGIQVSVK